MSFTLYDALVPSLQQVLGSMMTLLEKAKAHCAEQDLPDSALIEASVAPDMLPFGFQVKSTVVHSIGAIEAVRTSVFSPDRSPWPDSLDGLADLVSQGLAALEQLEPEEINSFIGRDMRFEAGDRRMNFTAETFLLSFSQPNFYFHATTAYDILRGLGLPLGKRDYLGAVRRIS